jgi:nitrite reductase/ring-hydroxylating ferredoxin subunit
VPFLAGRLSTISGVHDMVDDEVDDGWVAVATAAALAPGEVVAAEVEGPEGEGEVDLAIWRSFAGHCHVVEARCPHQWSHLAAEGVVDGEEIVCTAHFWRFDGQGRGTKLNVLGRRDDKADIRVFSCRERDGRIEVRIRD